MTLKTRSLAALLMTSAALVALASNEQTRVTKMPDTATSRTATYVCQTANHRNLAAKKPTQEYDKPGVCPTDGMDTIAKNSRLRVAVLVFHGVQDIDYAGPLEVFGQTGAKVFTVAATTDSVISTFGIKMQPEFDIDHAPIADVLLIPGGYVTAVTNNPKTMAWLRQRSGEVRVVLSVCTGAFILGKAGLLDGLSATTIAGASQTLAEHYPKVHVVTDRRYVDNGKIITTGGLSAGIDGALHVVDRELGRLRAEDVARGLEYEWRADGNGGFGLLASNQIPDVAALVPAGARWERTVDRGDTRRWEVRGHLGIHTGAQEFLDANAIKLKGEGWVPRAGTDKARRSFVKTRDGKAWQVDLTLAGEATPASYLLTLAVKQVSP